MKKGFTLIELLIVVAIIAILAAIAVPNFLEAQTRAKISRVASDMRTLNTGIEMYKIDNREYPPHGIFRDGRRVDGSLTPGPTWSRQVIDPVVITTPLAYVNAESVTRDVFQDKLFKNVPKTDFDNWSLGRLVYVSYDNPVARGGVGAREFGLYRFASAGPDQAIYNGQIPAEGTMGSRLIAGLIIPYDASNGTVSVGDIYRLQKGDLKRSYPPY